MQTIYVTGHRNPDTDSIVSAMAYAALKNALGERNYIPARLGELSDETKLVLERFHFEPPMRLHTVRTQVQDLAMDTPPCIGTAATVSHAWNLVQEDASSIALPVVNEDGTLYGMLSPSDIAAYDMQSISNTTVTSIPLFNLLSSLEGQLVNDANGLDAISGEVTVLLPQTHPLEKSMYEKSILICGDQLSDIHTAIQCKAACIIVCASQIDPSLEESCDTCIISTPFDAYRAARLIFQSIPVGRICQREDVVHFHLTDFVDDVRETMLETRFRSYPVLDEQERVVGTISRFHLIKPLRKRVVLVDHNETAQSVPGLEQADILEIIDHHRLADVQTGGPIYFRNEPVGSTATIIAGMFQERGIMPTKAMAGLLCAAIVSDTISFKSPTCTERDKRIAARMARMADVSLSDLGNSIFSASSSAERSVTEMLLSDFKEFHIAGHDFGIGQVTCMDAQQVLARADALFSAMQEEKDKRGYDFVMLMLTDVLQEGTELLFLGDEDTIAQAFNVTPQNNRVFLAGVMSRKKQVVPMLSLMWG